MAYDAFGGSQDGVSDPSTQMFLITPSTNELQVVPKAIRADSAGTVTIQPLNSPEVVTLNVVAGEIIPVRPIKVTAATATIHGMA